MATMLQGESRRMYSWWWDSHISPKNSKWLQENLTDMDRNVKSMIKLIEEDADSFARRAEMYYKKRPELMKLVEEFYRAYRALAERYDHATGALRQAHRTMAEAFPNQIPPFLPDDSPSPSSTDIGPHTPEIPSPLRSQLDPDESNNNFHARRRNIANFEENDSLSNKKGLKQLKEFFPEGKVRKVLKFKEEEGIESEIKLLQEEVSQLSSKNENLMSHMALESQRARELEETVSKLESVKEATLLQYKLSMERLTSLGNDISNTREELNTVNDEMVRKLNSVEEQCNAMEKVNKSLQFELESQRKELEEKGRKLEELNTQRAEEHEKRMQAEVALTSLQKVHTHTQEEAELLVLDIQRRNEKLKDMELRKASLEEKISELNETISNLHEQNVSVNAKIKDLQDEMKLLKEAKADLECELGIRFEENKALTQEKEVVSEKNVVLERSLSDVNVELEGSREKASALESSCKTLLSEVSTHIIEKGVLESQIEIISKNMEKLTEKSHLLENSLSDANVELDGLRVRCRNLEESWRSLSDQNSTLLAEKSDLVSEAENLETKYLELQGQHLTLERERDSTAHQVIKLQNSLILEKQENEALVSSLSTQFSSSHNQIVLLREENHQKAAVIETEQQKVMNSQLEIFILQRCLCDMKDKSILLHGECHNLLEAYTTAEDEISQLRHNELIQKKELRSISESNEVLRNGTCMLLTTLSINGMHKNVDDITDGELVQNVLGEIKNLMNSISDARDENQQLHLKEENLESKYLEMQDKFSILEREKDSTVHQIMELQSSLRLEKQEHGTLISSLSGQLASLHDQISLLQDENQLKVEVVEMEQQKVVNCLLEIFILQSCLCDLNDKNIFLYGELQNLLEASRITENQIFNLKHNELIKKKEITLLLEDNDVLRNGIRMLLEALSADGKHKNVEDFTNEELVETILGEIKCLMHSISDTQDKNQQLHLKVMDLETKYVTLQEQIANLEREKDSKVHRVLELEDCFRLEKQEHEANILSFSSQLASLQSRTHLLQEEILVKDESFDIEQQKAIFADLENFVLDRCLCDMKDKNLVLVETLQRAEKRIFELEHKDLIQKKELALLLNHGEILRASIHQLAQELNIDIKNRSMDDVSDEELLQNILGETKSMATSISAVQDENQQLHLKVSDLERKYLTLQDHHTNLEKEKDSAVNTAIKLEDSLRLQKQNHETIIISFSSQLASLQNQMHLLQQENFVKDEELEIEQQKAINVDLKNFVLHRCLCDMKDKNLILLEELKCAEKQICELGDEKLIQKKELSLLSNNSEIIRANIHLLLQELNIDMRNGSKDDSKDEVLLQNILGKVRDLLSSVSDAHDENQRLGLEELVLVTLFKEIGSDKFHLHQELESRTKELVALASEKNDLTVINEQLKDEKDFFVSQVNLIKQTVEILEKKYPQLEERNLKLESEKDSAFNQVFELENSLKLEKQEHHGFVLSSESKLSSLRTQLHLKENEFETEQEKSMNALLENFILKRCLHDMKESNVMLSGECRQLLEASKCLEEEKSHLCHDLVRQNEELLSAQIKKNEAMETNELLKAEMHLSHQRSQTEICSLLEDNRSLSKRLCSLKEKVNELEQEINDVLVEALALDELFIFFKTLSTERGLNVKLLSEDIRAQNKRMRELEAEIINLKESTILKEYDLNMARNLCEEFNRQIDTLKHKLTQKDMELSEAREENREFYGKVEDAKVMRKELEMEIKSLSSVITSKNEETSDVQVSNGLLHKQLERLNCDLEKEMNEIFKCEGEIEALLNDVHISTVDAAIYEEKVLELIVACERVEFVSELQRVPLCEEIAQKSALVDDLKKKLEDIEGENATSKRDFNALFDGLGCLEEQIFSLVKLQEKQDNGNSDILQHKISHQPSELDLQQLIVKVEALQKMIVDTKNILEQERLNSKAKIEAARTEIEELKLKEVLLQEISKEKYGQAIKDIQLDKVSKSRTNSYSRNKNRNAESDDQMLELWETAERDNIELVEEIKSEYPSCELNSEKEPSIEKLEVSAGVDESPEQWNKRFVEKLGSDAQRLVVLERSLHQLKAKLESSEKKKHLKTLEHGTLKVQLKEAEVAILEQVELNGELKKKVEENLISEERKHISEQAREGSEKIGKTELVLQKIEYIFLKANEEEEDKKIGCIDRKSSILLSEYIYGKDDGKGKKKSRFCGCMRPKTKG